MRINVRCYYLFLGTLLYLCPVNFYAQDTNKISLESYLSSTSQEYEVTFNYSVDDLQNITITQNSNTSSLDEVLQFLKKNTPFLYQRIGSAIITVLPKPRTFICGYILDQDTSEPIPNAAVTSGAQGTVTGEDGYFELDTDQNKDIIIRSLGYIPFSYNLTPRKGNECISLFIRPEQIFLNTVELSSYLVNGINKLSDNSLQIDFSDFTLLPGLVETDVLQATQALPGIQSIDETVSDINIRGGSNDQNLVLWDDIKMYQTGHFFGLISAFNPNITQSVSVRKNGTIASQTDGVSGTIAMYTDTEIAPETSGSIGVSLLSADGYVDISINDTSSLQFALRHSINNLLQTPTYDSYFDRISQETEVSTNEANIVNSNQDFTFYDSSARWLYEISKKDKIRVNFIIIGNDLGFTENATTNTSLESRNSSLTQNSISGGIYYEHLWNSSSKTHFQFYNTDYKLKAINASIFNDQRLLQENAVSESSVRLQHDLKLSEQLRFTGGYQLIEKGITNLNDIDNPLFRERIAEVVRSHGVYTQGYFRSPSDKSKLSLGVRGSYLDKFERFLLEPRITLSHRLTNKLTVQALGELKHQVTSQIVSLQNDFLGIENRRWQLANEQDIPILQSRQASLGFSYKQNQWLVDIMGYYKTIDGITTQSQGFDTKYEFTRLSGSYDVLGADVLVRKTIGNLNAWLSYSLMDNQYTFDELEEVQFPSNFDITHAITLGATYQYSRWKISAGLNWRTGQPTTFPILGNEISNGEINFGTANADRLSDYLRADVSALYDVVKTDLIRLETGFSIWNFINNDNTIGTFYRVVDDDVARFEEKALSTTANFILRCHF